MSSVHLPIPYSMLRSRIRLIFWLLVSLLVLAAAYRYHEKAEKPSRVGTQTRTAILRWTDQVQRLMRGENVYPAGNPYPNPPIMGLILSPLYELRPIQTAMLWFALKVLLAAVSIYWTLQLLRTDDRWIPDWVVGGFILLSLHPILGDLSHGNVNIFIAFLVVGTLAAYQRGWDWLAGLILALAIACKITPLLFVPYFGWKWLLAARQRWRESTSLAHALGNPGLRVLAGVAIGLVLWFVLLPGAKLGWAPNLQLLENWYTGMVRPFLIEGKITSEHANQSLPGLLVRLLTNEPSSLDYDDEERAIATEFHNLTDIGPEAVRWIIRGFQVLFVVGLIRWCSAPVVLEPRQRCGLRFAAECSYIILGMLLFSERTWKHHGVVLMVPYAVLLLKVSLESNVVWRRMWMGILAAVAGLTLMPSLISGDFQDHALAYGSYTLAYGLLLVGVLLVLKREETHAPARPPVQSTRVS